MSPRGGDVDPQRRVMGYSFGGYLAPRVVAFEHRYAACIAFGAMHWDLHGWQKEIKERLAADPKTSTSSNFQFRWVIGAPDNATALEWAKRFTLAQCIDAIRCPVLVLHGENDRIVPVAEARTLYDKLGDAQASQDFHRGGRRRRALPGRQPPDGDGHDRRLADRNLGPAAALTGVGRGQKSLSPRPHPLRTRSAKFPRVEKIAMTYGVSMHFF